MAPWCMCYTIDDDVPEAQAWAGASWCSSKLVSSDSIITCQTSYPTHDDAAALTAANHVARANSWYHALLRICLCGLPCVEIDAFIVAMQCMLDKLAAVFQ